MFQKVDDASFISGEHEMLRFWRDQRIFERLREKNRGKPRWSFLDGPITANNPMGVHHAWGRTYKDAFQRYFAMLGRDQRFQNGFDCQGLWVEVEVEKELKLGTKRAIEDYGIDRFVRECKKRVLRFAARQTEQSIRLGYWMEWDDPDELTKLAEGVGSDEAVSYVTARGQTVTAPAEQIVEKLGNAEWGGSYFTFSTENNETIWTFLKKCFTRGKVYQGHDVMPWSGRAGSAYSQMEVADGRKLTVHRSCFVKFPIVEKDSGFRIQDSGTKPTASPSSTSDIDAAGEFLLVWTTTPWTLTSNVAAAVNPDLDYLKVRSKKDGAIYYFAKDNLDSKRMENEFKFGFGRPEWKWPDGVPKLKSLGQLFKELGGYEIEAELKGEQLVGWRYKGPFDELAEQIRKPQFTGEPSELGNPSAWSDSLKRIRAAAFEVHMRFNEDFRNAELSHRKQLEGGLRDREKPAVDKAQFDEAINNNADDAWRFAVDVWASEFRRIVNIDLEAARAWGIGKADRFLSGASTFQEIDLLFRNLGVAQSLPSEWTSLRHQIDAIEQEGRRPIEFWNVRESPALLRLQLRSVHAAFASALWDLPTRSGVESHRVIDGGRDSKGNANVNAGDGTGIVHIAPGCGDIDHELGEMWEVRTIAPLKEDGTYGDGFGPFTGRKAVDPETAQMVFDSLKEKGLLFYVEQYPHIYPFCWRTGDELVFRLVDEWFINMDWRDEIKDVTKAIQWLPDSLQGQERELEWLTTMRDWMISKKRFWGLALPIWVNPNDPSDFEVIGSLKELKERAVEGWDDFEGHTPHRPWIDGVKIKSRKTGAVLSRVTDVGNPWLDAGIVPFSTMQYNTNRQEWEKWYPADLVTESFPGQFRNWFYSLLSLATMMRYDEADDAVDKRPFKTLFGYRLVMNEEGKPMHKSDGTAIWFEEAAEQLGVDALRWLYLAQNPAQDLRFGTRHPDEPVTLQTPEGPISQTKEGLPTCKVTSKPVDEVRRQVLIPLWNSYAFFVNYARLDGFTPDLPTVPVAERPEIDRWLLSNLQSLIATCRKGFEEFDTGAVTKAASTFIDDLSNWYIRRNRRRFWRVRTEARGQTSEVSEGSGIRDQGSEGKDSGFRIQDSAGGVARAVPIHNPQPTPHWEEDKLAAYQTLYETLVTLSKLLAPCIPFLSERMYQNLVVGSVNAQGADAPRAPESVHLCDYPVVDAALLDESLNHRMATAQRVVSMGHRLRETADRRVRQPLAELKYACANLQDADDIAKLADVIADELNVKKLTPATNLDDLVHYTYKPNLKTLGPKLGKQLNAVKSALPTLGDKVLGPLRRGEPVTITIDGSEIALAPEDVMVSTEQASDWAAADDAGVQIALSTKLTPELIREGAARDFIRQVQQLRKDHDLDENERIVVAWQSDDADVAAALTEWDETIRAETRASRIEPGPVNAKAVTVGSADVRIAFARVT
jgi:isoleucyl-tRNA synthetase